MRAADYLALEHNVTIASAAVFLIGFGEELWKKFLPKYLEALGATTPIIGLFGTAEDFFDACYQYPGGFVADRFGRRRAFLIFITLASLGYLVYLFSTSWPFLFVGLALVMAWQSMASPAIFAVIGDSLPRERRAMGFTLQSIRHYRVNRRSTSRCGVTVRRGPFGSAIVSERCFSVQHRDDRAQATGEPGKIVPAFSDRHHAAAAALIGDRRERRCQPRELICAQAHSAKWIVCEGIEASRDQNQLGSKLPQHWKSDRFESDVVVSVGGSGIKRQVNREPGALACSGFCRRACARVGTGIDARR